MIRKQHKNDVHRAGHIFLQMRKKNVGIDQHMHFKMGKNDV